MIASCRVLWLMRLVRITIATANLVVGIVEVAAATFLGIRFVRLAVHHSVAALALSGIVHSRFTTTRVRPKDAVIQLSVAAYLGRPVFTIGFVAAARVILTVDDLIAAASGVIAVRFLHNLPIAAKFVSGIVGRGTTATSIGGLWINHVITTDVGGLIVGIVTTAVGVATVILAFQLAMATDVVVTVVDLTATATIRVAVVHRVSTASGVWAVGFVEELVVTTKIGAGVVGRSAAVVRVVSR